MLCERPGGWRWWTGRELYLPAVWTTDRERCQAAGVPESVGFATKPQLAVGMLARLLGRLPAAWVAADAVYGPDTWLRAWLEGRRMGYVLGIRPSGHLEVASGAGCLPARELTGHLEAPAGCGLAPGRGWRHRAGGTGPAWSWRPPTVYSHTRWLLARRYPEDPTELAWYVAAGPPGTLWRCWRG